MTIFLQALNYLIDAYLMVAASAISANTFLRSFFGAGFPLFATAMCKWKETPSFDLEYFWLTFYLSQSTTLEYNGQAPF